MITFAVSSRFVEDQPRKRPAAGNWQINPGWSKRIKPNAKLVSGKSFRVGSITGRSEVSRKRTRAEKKARALSGKKDVLRILGQHLLYPIPTRGGGGGGTAWPPTPQVHVLNFLTINELIFKTKKYFSTTSAHPWLPNQHLKLTHVFENISRQFSCKSSPELDVFLAISMKSVPNVVCCGILGLIFRLMAYWWQFSFRTLFLCFNDLKGEVRRKMNFTYVLGFVVLRDVVKVFPVSSSSFARKTTGRNRARSHSGAWRGLKTKWDLKLSLLQLSPTYLIRYLFILVGTTTPKLKLDAFRLWQLRSLNFQWFSDSSEIRWRVRGARETPAPRDSLNFRRASLLSINEFESGTFTIVLYSTSSFTYLSVIYGANFKKPSSWHQEWCHSTSFLKTIRRSYFCWLSTEGNRLLIFEWGFPVEIWILWTSLKR